MSKKEPGRTHRAETSSGGVPGEGSSAGKRQDGVPAAVLNEAQDTTAQLKTSNDELRRALHDLTVLQRRYTDLHDGAPCGYITCDAHQRVTGVNKTLGDLLQQSPEELVDRPLDSLVRPTEEDRRVFAEHWRILSGHETAAQCEVQIMSSNGKPLTAHLDSRSYFDDQGRLFECRIALTDMTAQRRAEAREREKEAIYHKVMDLTPNAMFSLTQDGSFHDCNAAGQQLIGMNLATILQSNLRAVFRLPDDHDGDLVAALWSGEEIREIEVLREDGVRTLRAAMTRITQGDVPLLFVIGTEVTVHKQMESSLRRDVLHDRLTGLPNRQLFMEEVDRALKRARREKEYQFGVLFIDVDHFKMINDTFGHLAGDDLLDQLGGRLLAVVRELDVLARFAGDEFALLMEGINNKEDVDATADRILHSMKQPFALAGREVFVTVSVGGTINAARHATADQIVREADDAMYTAKRNGRSRYEPFSERTHRALNERIDLENRLRAAIDQGVLSLRYQPIVSATPVGGLLGLEALVRWPRGECEPALPATFLPVVREMGMTRALTRLVLRETCGCLSKWSSQGWLRAGFFTSVNICPPLFNESGLVGLVAETIAEAGIDAKLLAVEITETALLDGSKVVGRNVAGLQEMGVRVMIDNFGAGHSGLAHLCRFPVNAIKIDRACVDMLDRREEGRRLINGMITLGQGMQLDVVASGVETRSQFECLREVGCRALQGFLFSPALAADEIEPILIHGAVPLDDRF